MSFAIVDPIVAFWGGLLAIPTVYYGMFYDPWTVCAAAAGVYAVQYTATRSSHARHYYQRYTVNGAKDIIYLNEVDRTVSCVVELVIPHGIYGIASKPISRRFKGTCQKIKTGCWLRCRMAFVLNSLD